MHLQRCESEQSRGTDSSQLSTVTEAQDLRVTGQARGFSRTTRKDGLI